MLHSADPAPPTPHSPAPSVSFVMNVLKITTIIITSRGESSAVYKATLPSQGPLKPPRGQPWGPELALMQPLQTWLCLIPPCSPPPPPPPQSFLHPTEPQNYRLSRAVGWARDQYPNRKQPLWRAPSQLPACLPSLTVEVAGAYHLCPHDQAILNSSRHF